MAEETTASIQNTAVAELVFRPYSAFHDSGIGTSIPAQTEYALSHTSFQSSNTEGEQESVWVPATPTAVSKRKPFECFLCRRMLSDIKNRVEWKMHFFADLRPYICTFADCEDKLAQFPNRSAWAEHEFSRHRITQSWSCPKCPQAFISVSGWQSHIQEKHYLFFSGHQCNVAKDIAYRTEATRIEDEECPLCRIVVGKPRRAFVKHVGRHMEEIALRALPPGVEEDSEEDCLSTDRTSSDEGRTSSHAHPSIRTVEDLQYRGVVRRQRDDLSLLWVNASPEGLRDAAGKGDLVIFDHILKMRPRVETEAVLAAARGGHDGVLNLMMAIGNLDPDPEPLRTGEYEPAYSTPMLAAIGRGSISIIQLLLSQPGFNPSRRVFKDLTYYEISEERQGSGWQEEYHILKEAYDNYMKRNPAV